MPAKQGRYWLLTIPQHHFVPWLPPGLCYIRGQLERGGETDYLHWQVLAQCEQKCTLSRIRQIFGPVHAELSRSTAADAYVWKEDTRVEGTQFELGQRPVRRNVKEDWERVWETAKAGNYEQIDAVIRVQHYRTLRTIRSDYAKGVGMERSCYVFWGRTGTGKSRRAWDEAGFDAFPKDPRTKWWDGYQGESHVVIDEFRGDISISHMLRWLDRYPVLVEIKGATKPLLATTFWITSNDDPRSWYPDQSEESRSALMRRFNITYFP